MRVSVSFAGNMASLTDNQKKITCELESGSSLDDLICLMDRRFAGIRRSLCTEDGDVVDHINVYVNGDNVRQLNKLDTVLKEGDAIHVIPAAAAG